MTLGKQFLNMGLYGDLDFVRSKKLFAVDLDCISMNIPVSEEEYICNEF